MEKLGRLINRGEMQSRFGNDFEFRQLTGAIEFDESPG